MARWLTNPTRSHEVAGLVPGLAQWVKEPTARCRELWCRSQMWLRSCVAVAVAVASSCSSDSAVALIQPLAWEPKKQKKKKKEWVDLVYRAPQAWAGSCSGSGPAVGVVMGWPSTGMGASWGRALLGW